LFPCSILLWAPAAHFFKAFQLILEGVFNLAYVPKVVRKDQQTMLNFQCSMKYKEYIHRRTLS
jgi:hypothetical protein